ncbi:MAG: GNAT family N-acetyltransferase [Desulfobacteraceae bacterium]|nr:GNAT family N-acetyltransferase [Desulfobacteraceae bacterium]
MIIPSIEIAIATPKDTKMILMLQYLAYQSEAELYNDFSIPPLTQSLKDLESSFSDLTFLKASINDKIIGSVRAKQQGDTCFIGRIIVHPDDQGKGIGTSLLTAMEEAFPNVSRYELFTGAKSVKNLGFYKKLGYQEFKTEQLSDKVTLTYLEKKS